MDLKIRLDRAVNSGAPVDTESDAFVRLALAAAADKLGPNGALVVSTKAKGDITLTSADLRLIAMGKKSMPDGLTTRAVAFFCDDLASAANAGVLKNKIATVDASDAGLATLYGYPQSPTEITIKVGGSGAVTLPAPGGASAMTPAEALVAVNANPETYKSLPLALRADPAICKSAFSKMGQLLEFAPNAVKQDAALAAVACIQKYEAIEFVGANLTSSLSFANTLADAQYVRLSAFSEDVRGNAALREKVFTRWYGNGPPVDAQLKKDFEQYIAEPSDRGTLHDKYKNDSTFTALLWSWTSDTRFVAADSTAPALNDVNTWILVGKMNPARASAYPILAEISALPANELQTLRTRVKNAGICMFERFANVAELRRVLDDLDQRNSGECVLVMACRQDHNGFFTDMLDKMRAEHPGKRLVYQEVNDAADVGQALETQGASPTKRPIVAGHGKALGIQLGSSGWLSMSDMTNPSVLRGRKGVAKGATIILHSCSTGSPNEHGANMANAVANMFPQATVYAPKQALYATKFEGTAPTFSVSQDQASAGYRVGPMQP